MQVLVGGGEKGRGCDGDDGKGRVTGNVAAARVGDVPAAATVAPAGHVILDPFILKMTDL
jgi:hypothetical protein